ncbi:hypothetical protein DY000_02024531 [Brassica cretica]|uniref:Uncharacterized protein n=1 Tax=Brassica cretica TaxID=69181 RepID=A0ABQ7EHY7_BRACR|nr:hypothetical protein DY000_02024531 [Brassica cretica]
MDTRLKDKEKEKEKEKDMAPGERTPKVSGVGREPSALAGDVERLNQGFGQFRREVLGPWPDLGMIGYTKD